MALLLDTMIPDFNCPVGRAWYEDLFKKWIPLDGVHGCRMGIENCVKSAGVVGWVLINFALFCADQVNVIGLQINVKTSTSILKCIK